MKRVLFIGLIALASCQQRPAKADDSHIEKLAVDFMHSDVIPHMKDPKPYEVSGATVVRRTAADVIHEYEFTYRNLSFNEADRLANKRHLESILAVFPDPGQLIEITVNVAYNTRYRRGNVVTDSVKLAYDPQKDKITYWPF